MIVKGGFSAKLTFNKRLDMDKLVRQEVKLSKENYEVIKSLKESENATFNEIINAMISRYTENKNEKLARVKKRTPSNHKIIALLTQDEYTFLQEQAKYHGFSSATKELKFRLTNSIYSNGIFSNIEMKDMMIALTDLNKLGRNINELVRILKEKKDAKININIERIGDLLNNIYSKIDTIGSKITNYQKQLDDRVG